MVNYSLIGLFMSLSVQRISPFFKSVILKTKINHEYVNVMSLWLITNITLPTVSIKLLQTQMYRLSVSPTCHIFDVVTYCIRDTWPGTCTHTEEYCVSGTCDWNCYVDILLHLC